MINIGLLIIRVVIGVIFMGHGAQKLFGWFGGYGIKGTGGWFESIGIKPGTTMALLAGLTELIGGILFTIGPSYTTCGDYDCRNNGNGNRKGTCSKWIMVNRKWLRI